MLAFAGVCVSWLPALPDTCLLWLLAPFRRQSYRATTVKYMNNLISGWEEDAAMVTSTT